MKIFRILVAMAVLALAGSAGGQTLTTLYSFGATATDAAFPYAGLLQASDGNFYGTTSGGGSNDNGTVFRISPNGSFAVLYSFSDAPAPAYTNNDGTHPQARLVQGSDGSFYGTTYYGGVSTNCQFGCGTVFKISPSGNFTNLYSFSASDGANPYAGLVWGSDGNYYGTTQSGGSSNLGSVFRISPNGTLTNLYSFTGGDGAHPQAGLVEDVDGNFYGTTYFGGAYTNCPGGCGTVFRINPSAVLTNLHSFSGPPDGALPSAGLVRGNDGNFYGSTENGGANGWGTVFRITPGGSLTNLHSFTDVNDGSNPQAGLVLGSDGSFYGATGHGGPSMYCSGGCGTLFGITPGGSLTNLYKFSYADGAYPRIVLVQSIDGNLYGTTLQGGTNGDGTVFQWIVPFSPPANQINSFQPMGTNVVFTIPSVAGETYQLQFATDLVSGNWSNVVGVCVSNSIGAALSVTNFGGATGPQGFYRFAITP